MKMKIRMAEMVLVASCLSTLAEPGGTYTLTGEEKGVEEIIQADMAQFPELYEGVSPSSYLLEFKQKNKIGKRKFSPGDILYFPDTPASRNAKNDSSAAEKEKPEKPKELPGDFKLRDLPEVVQEGSYCVPACAEVIARYHGIKTDQWEIAKLSSQNSMDNSGTNPYDMARALENFGIQFHPIQYKHKPDDVDEFIKKTLPQFKEALVNEGPMYISIREIFGGNHGCVVIGYNDDREKIYFYNPWGEEFNLSYKEVAKYSYQAIAFALPKLAEDENIDLTSFIATLKQATPNKPQDVIALMTILKRNGISYEFVDCNRRDIMDDASKTERLARSEGQKLLDAALERAPAILIPQTDDEGMTDYLFIRKSPESKSKLLVQRIGSNGWGEPELSSSRLLVRFWTTPVKSNGKTQWWLPLFEFSGTVKARSGH